MLELQRDIKLDLIAGKYKAISAYKIPKMINGNPVVNDAELSEELKQQIEDWEDMKSRF